MISKKHKYFKCMSDKVLHTNFHLQLQNSIRVFILIVRLFKYIVKIIIFKLLETSYLNEKLGLAFLKNFFKKKTNVFFSLFLQVFIC